MLRCIVLLALLGIFATASDPNVHYQSHTSFFGNHPTPIANMYVGRESRQLNLVLEFSRPVHLPHRNLTASQTEGRSFFYGHPTVYLVPSRSRKIHYSDTFHESAIPGASTIELYSEGVTRYMHADIIGTYREMPDLVNSAVSPARPPGSLSYVSNGYHYASGLLRIDGALFLGPESLTWQKFAGFVLEHSQLNLISKETHVKPIMTKIEPLRIPCDLFILQRDTTTNMDTFEDFCSFSVYWPETGRQYVLTFDTRTPFSYLPEDIYRHFYTKDERKSDVDSYLAVEVGEAHELLVLPPVTWSGTSYMRQRTSALTSVITLGRDAVFFYRDVFGMQMHPVRELIIAAPHPYHPTVNFGPKTSSAITTSGVFHVIFLTVALIALFIFRGPTTNLLVRIGSFNSYDKYEMRIETFFQFITMGTLIGSIVLTIVSPWRVHGVVFIIGTIGAAIHVILLITILAYDPVPLTMRLGFTPYFPKRNRINEPATQMNTIPDQRPILPPQTTSLRKRKSIFTRDTTLVPLMTTVLSAEHPKTKACCEKETPKIYDTCSRFVFWVDDIPHIYYNMVTLDFMRSMVNVNSTIFIMYLFSLSYEFKFAFFSVIMMTQLLAITAVVYMVQSAIVVRWFSHTRRLSDGLSVAVTVLYGTILIFYYGIAGNMLLFQQLQEANSFYPNTSVPIEIAMLINIGGILYSAFALYGHIESLISNFSRIKLDQPDPTIHISTLSSHIK